MVGILSKTPLSSHVFCFAMFQSHGGTGCYAHPNEQNGRGRYVSLYNIDRWWLASDKDNIKHVYRELISGRIVQYVGR